MRTIILSASLLSALFTLVMVVISSKTLETAKYLLASLIFISISLYTAGMGVHSAVLMLLLFSNGAVVFIFLIKIARKMK